jgi:RNA polymerase sigma-70 factor, ECF subfamily
MKSEEELLLEWRNGDREAGSQLLAKYIPLLRRYYDARIPDQSEDLIQQTLMEFVRDESQASSGSGRAYLLAIARHRLVDHLRAAGRRFAADPVSSSAAIDQRTTPSQRVNRRELNAIVQDCFRKMPEEFRLVLELHYWEGFSMAEIADVLGVPTGTAKSRVRLARAEFSRCFDARCRRRDTPAVVKRFPKTGKPR